MPITREEEGIGIASGLTLGGAKPLLVIQDNGIGNCLTALTTFPQPYHLPIVMLVSQREDWQHHFKLIDPKNVHYYDKEGNKTDYAALLAELGVPPAPGTDRR